MNAAFYKVGAEAAGVAVKKILLLAGSTFNCIIGIDPLATKAVRDHRPAEKTGSVGQHAVLIADAVDTVGCRPQTIQTGLFALLALPAILVVVLLIIIAQPIDSDLAAAGCFLGEVVAIARHEIPRHTFEFVDRPCFSEVAGISVKYEPDEGVLR